MPLWVWYVAGIAVALLVGALAGVDWERRSRVRDLKRKRADITRALERDER